MKNKTCTAKAIVFDISDANGDIISKSAISSENLNRLEIGGEIISHEIEEGGIIVEKAFEIKNQMKTEKVRLKAAKRICIEFGIPTKVIGI